MRRRRFVRKRELPVPVAHDDYSEPCERCGAQAGEPCVIQTEGFRQYPNVPEGAEFIPAGTVALRIHWERIIAVRRRRQEVAQQRMGYQSSEESSSVLVPRAAHPKAQYPVRVTDSEDRPVDTRKVNARVVAAALRAAGWEGRKPARKRRMWLITWEFPVEGQHMGRAIIGDSRYFDSEGRRL